MDTTGPFMELAGRLAPSIRERADEIEATQHVPDDVIADLRKAGWYRANLAAACGGGGLRATERFEVVEALSAADASTGWVSAITSGGPRAAMAAAPEATRVEVLGVPPGVPMAGYPGPGGRLTADGDGFRVSGRWPFGSGFDHAEWIFAGANVFEEGRIKQDANGRYDFRTVIVPKAEVRIDRVWSATGLRATASHDFAMDNVYVPAHRVLPFTYSPVGPLGASSVALAAVVTGTALEAISAYRALMERKRPRVPGPPAADHESAQLALAEAMASVAAGRLLARDGADAFEERLDAGDEIQIEERGRFRASCVFAAQSAKHAVGLLYEAAGGSAPYSSGRLDRLFRDVNTACAHVVLRRRTYVSAGSDFLGKNDDFRAF